MECAILRCHQFLTGYADFPNVLSRLANMTRGIGDPMVATYMRAYLVRCGININANLKPYIQTCFQDNLTCACRQLTHSYWSKRLASQSLDPRRYVELLGPASDWIVHCLGHGASQQLSLSLFKDYLAQYPLAQVRVPLTQSSSTVRVCLLLGSWRFFYHGPVQQVEGEAARGDAQQLLHILRNMPHETLSLAATDGINPAPSVRSESSPLSK